MVEIDVDLVSELVSSVKSMCESRGGGTWDLDPPPPMKNHKNIGFSSNTGPDPLQKIAKPAFNVGPPHGWASAELPRNRVSVNLFLRHIRDLSR